MNKNLNEKLQQLLETAVDEKKVFGTSFCLKHRDGLWCGSSGNLGVDTPYFIASTTKLFVTAIILSFRSRGLLGIGDKIGKYLDHDILQKLHVFRGKEYSEEITIENLMAHTSGIPDYFQGKGKSGESLEKELFRGNDQSWDLRKVLERSKSMEPLFAPNSKGKAHYSDTNYQLLGKIIENITGKSISENYEELVFNPLGLSKTYLYCNIEDTTPKMLYYKRSPLHIPKAMASFGPDGGVVSTSGEMMVFLEAFFGGFFFPKTEIEKLKIWNRIFFPMQSGVGIHRFKLPWFFDPMGSMPELLGHSGLSGALAYHAPAQGLYITGTVNQVAFPDTSFRLAIKLIQKLLG